MSDIINVINELINKTRGYGKEGAMGKTAGKEAEAVDHGKPTDAPGADEKEKEKNAANSGTHPEAGGGGRKSVSGSRPEGGESFPDGGAEEDEIKGVSGKSGRAPQGHADALKHEGGGTGPNHPGTATETQKQQKSTTADLKKDGGEDEDEDKEKDGKEDEEKEEKSHDPEVYLDIDEFAAEIAKTVKAQLLEELGPSLEKSHETEYVQAGLAKSVSATIDRLEEVEKAVVNIARALNVKKSLLKSADNIKSVDNPSLSKSTLSKSDISSRLLDMNIAGVPGVDPALVLRFDAVGDTSVIPEAIRTKLGIE